MLHRCCVTRSSASLTSVLVALLVVGVGAQATRRAQAPQKIDEAYTAKIKEFTQGPRISTELVDLADDAQVPVYFNQDPVLNAGGGGIPPEFAAFFGGGAQIPGVGQNTTPMATRLTLSPWEPDAAAKPAQAGPTDVAAFQALAAQFGVNVETARPRVVMRFPQNPAEMLLSGTLAGGQALANRAQVVDVPLGKGHVVMFAIRPFWRWQSQGTYFLGFNALRTWNDLDAGQAAR